MAIMAMTSQKQAQIPRRRSTTCRFVVVTLCCVTTLMGNHLATPVEAFATTSRDANECLLLRKPSTGTANARPSSFSPLSMRRSSSNSNSNSNSNLKSSNYQRPEDIIDDNEMPISKTTGRRPLTPKVGDLVRYFDLDGGKANGEELVGRITFLTKVVNRGSNRGSSSGSSSGSSQRKDSYLAELTELENIGDGYFAEYSSQKRMSKKTDRDIAAVSPIVASFVRSEQAYKVPMMRRTTTLEEEEGGEGGKGPTARIQVRQESYDLDEWEGPQAALVNQDIVQTDGEAYLQLKTTLLKNAALTGLLGSVVTSLVKGPEDAIIYFMGALASVGYLFFLSVKTDTLASPDRKLGSNVANVRFVLPIVLLVGVALYNQSRGDANPLAGPDQSVFDTVTAEQFGAAILGFLTYRIPLFVGQVQVAFQQEGSGGSSGAGSMLPGSAGVALQLAKDAASTSSATTTTTTTTTTNGLDDANDAAALIPVLLVSGPQATGRTELVNALLEQDDRLVSPILVDQQVDGVTFERLVNRQEFLQIDGERYGMTKGGILTAASKAQSQAMAAAAVAAATATATTEEKEVEGGIQVDESTTKVVVVNADVALAKKLQATLSGTRLIGVWVGLDSVSKFEQRLEAEMDAGTLVIPSDETRESVLRARIKEIVNEIDYGLSSGIFEFTILNTDPTKSLEELKEAASYCFK